MCTQARLQNEKTISIAEVLLLATCQQPAPHTTLCVGRQLEHVARGEVVPVRQAPKTGGHGPVKDPDKRAALITRTLDLVQTKLDMMK